MVVRDAQRLGYRDFSVERLGDDGACVVRTFGTVWATGRVLRARMSMVTSGFVEMSCGSVGQMRMLFFKLGLFN